MVENGRDSKGLFVANSKEVKALASKGGKSATKPKGFAALSPEARKEASRLGVLKRNEKRNQGRT